MNTLFGITAVIVGCAYLGMGLITGNDLRRHWRTRGWSPFGGAFTVMAFTCGPHHLVHGTHVLLHGERVDPLLSAAILLGLPAAVIFIGLRIETLLGGRGDRLIRGTPAWLAILPWAVSFSVGIIAAAGARHVAANGAPGIEALPNAILATNYLLVGFFMLRTQAVRRPAVGGWSLSGVSLGAVFPTCALMHAAFGLTAVADVHSLTLDILGVPSSFYFLWVVRGLHRESLRDWNRRPLVGNPLPPRRPAPWAPGA